MQLDANLRQDPDLTMVISHDVSLFPRGFSPHVAQISFTQIKAVAAWPVDTVFVDIVKTCCRCSK